MISRTTNSGIMNKETLLALTGTILLLLVFTFRFESMKESSPLALLLIVSIGLLSSFKFKLAGGSMLCFGGLALLIHPLIFSSAYWLIPGAALVGIGGILILFNWWKQNEN